LGTAGPRAARRPPVERAALAQLLAWLGRCNGNINQIAKVANTMGDVPPGAPEAIADIRAAVAAIMRALGKRDV
jgi:hypothetical protein